MSLLEWWNRRRAESAADKWSRTFANGQVAIAHFAPELTGMGPVKGEAFIQAELDKFEGTATTEQSIEFSSRVEALRLTWDRDGLTVPWWGRLCVLRIFQNEIAENRWPKHVSRYLNYSG